MPRSYRVVGTFIDGKFARLKCIRRLSTADNLAEDIDWNDRIGLQSRWTLEEKGWKVKVDWRPTAYGAGLFAAQDVPNGTVLRKGIFGRNLLSFESVSDIEKFFCQAGNKAVLDQAKLDYVVDYLYGFTPTGTDEQGYLLENLLESGPGIIAMWIPGNGLNHNLIPNTVYRSSPQGIDLVAIRDLRKDEELVDDYRRHGSPPTWLLDFAKKYQVKLNFAGYNSFVNPSE